MKKQRISVLVAVLGLLVLTIGSSGAVPRAHAQDSRGAVYTMTNGVAGNQVLRYDRAPDGTLTLTGTFSTGGVGTGAGLGNQGGLVLSSDRSTLIAVNAGSNDISVFHVTSGGLELTDRAGSQGATPISVTIHGDLVYVLDTGGASGIGNIAGYALSADGELSPIAGSVHPLSGMAAPAQISFNPDGTILVVTEKSTNRIDTYKVNPQGIASAPRVQDSSGATPFGFGFTSEGILIVSEAAGGPAGTSAVSSYSISHSGKLATVSGSVPDGQVAACWIVVTSDDRFTYTTNTHSNTISSYAVASGGSIALLNSVAASTGPGPIDEALSQDSTFLYVLESGAHAIQGFRVQTDGSLTLIVTISGIPTGSNGIASD